MKQGGIWILIIIGAWYMSGCGSVPSDLPQQAGSADEEPVQLETIQPHEPTEAPVNLSVNDLNPNPPPDILDEVRYFGGMGGMDDCLIFQHETPSIVLGMGTDVPQLMRTMLIYACGLPQNGEDVLIRVTLPDNSNKEFRQRAEPIPGQNFAQIEFSYKADLYDPAGMYHFLFEGDGWSIEQNIMVSEISFPSIYLVGSQLVFVEFRPNESLRLFIYDPAELDYENSTIKLVGWRELQVDAQGQLVIEVDYSDGAYAAIGETSGEVHYDGWQGASILAEYSPLDQPATPIPTPYVDPAPASTEVLSEVSLGEWMIIVGAGFSSYETAWEWLWAYQQFGYPTQVFYRETYIRAAVIGFSSQSEAEGLLQSIQAINPEAYVRSVEEWCPLQDAYPDHIECR